MANIEKLVKSLEALRISHGTSGNDDISIKWVLQCSKLSLIYVLVEPITLVYEISVVWEITLTLPHGC